MLKKSKIKINTFSSLLYLSSTFVSSVSLLYLFFFSIHLSLLTNKIQKAHQCTYYSVKGNFIIAVNCKLNLNKSDAQQTHWALFWRSVSLKLGLFGLKQIVFRVQQSKIVSMNQKPISINYYSHFLKPFRKWCLHLFIFFH